MTATTPIRAAQEPPVGPGTQTCPAPVTEKRPPIEERPALKPVPGKLPGSRQAAATMFNGQPAARSGMRPAVAPPLRAADEAVDIRAMTRGTVQAAMEVLAGTRPIHQLARRLDPRCLATLQHRAALIRREVTRTASPALARLHRNSTVGSVRVCEVSDGIYEASAVVVDDVRARAVAVRLERSKQVWRVTELVIG